MKGFKLKDLKLKEFDSIKEMFDKAFKRVNIFEDFRTELVKGKEKRVGEELIQESTKKQKVEDDKEKAELKQLIETILDEKEVAIDAISLAVKSPRIVDWKINKEGKKSYYQIVRANGQVLDLEKTKTSQCSKIDSLKRRVKKLKKRNRSRTHNLKRLYKVGLTAKVESSDNEESLGEDASKQERRIDVIDADDEITLVNDVDNEMCDVDDPCAQALEMLKTSKPKVKGIVLHEPSKSTTSTTTISSQHLQDKCKGIMIQEPVKPKKKDQIRLDEKAPLELQAKFDEEERLARDRAKKEQEANISLIETWDDI
uniref:Uncharacterized protein n=1 Tax=Tanacetum cinerariifolium TaxID=118510 RepID=A0A6L2LBG6_TANCI|nr:hypothetical protein [Tanacetum cinerariifolium]